MKPLTALRMAILTILIAISTSSGKASADVILTYTGSSFDSFLGSGDFTGGDFVTGTIRFANIGDTQAKSFSLSTTVGGAPGFSFDVVNASDPSVTLNSFDWAGTSLPVFFGLTVGGEMFGTLDGPELISISDIGDLAIIDDLAPTESIGFNMAAGGFSSVAVPEPSSFAALGMGVIGILAARGRRKSASTDGGLFA